jgi:ATP/ADP translocase
MNMTSKYNHVAQICDDVIIRPGSSNITLYVKSCMDCPGIEPGFPIVVTFASVMQLGRVLCLFVASYLAIFSFFCTVFIYVTFVTYHKETILEMLDENAEPFVSHKRKDPRSFAREFVGKSKC